MNHVHNWLDYALQQGVYQQFSILTRVRVIKTGSIMSVSHTDSIVYFFILFIY